MQLFYTVTYLYKHECLTRLKQMLLHRSGYIYRRCKRVDTSSKNVNHLKRKCPSYHCIQSQYLVLVKLKLLVYIQIALDDVYDNFRLMANRKQATPPIGTWLKLNSILEL